MCGPQFFSDDIQADGFYLTYEVFNGTPSNCFPASTGLGSSFDVDLAREIGEALGQESRAKSTIILVPFQHLLT